MIEPFLGRYEPWLISRQACGSGRCNSRELQEVKRNVLLIKNKNAKTKRRKICKSKLLSGEKGGPSAQRMGDS